MPRHTHAAHLRPPFAGDRRQAAQLDRLARAGILPPPRLGAPEWREPEGAPRAAREVTASGLHVVRFRPALAVESLA
jgi:hypothetical protein